MKKIFPLYLVALFSLIFVSTSCNKKSNWVCRCSVTHNGNNYTVDSAIANDTKSQANSECQTIQTIYNYTYGMSGSSSNISVATCSLN